MKISVFDTAEQVGRSVATRIAAAIAQQPTLVLGLATGRTPVRTYAELRAMHRAGELDASGITTFNLDEFIGIEASHPGSFRAFMERHLLAELALRAEQVHFLEGAAPDPEAECVRYEAAIEAAGGIDLQLLGLGSNGHIGFNEPADTLAARTHRVTLDESTRRDNVDLFGGNLSRVPREALTMGMGTILKSSALLLVATGERKAHCVEGTVRGPLSTRLPASFLQVHGQVELFLDAPAASRL